jgi:hypothetical protein
MKINIETYALRVCGGPEGLREPKGVRAQIRLYPEVGTDSYTISFYEEPYPAPAEVEGGHMNLPMSAFATVVDILRNEKPVNLIWKRGVGYFLQTDHERVGEGDPKPFIRRTPVPGEEF